jgi:phenylpyruvate tautomerase PptA (4-oxalocrotonate tautomerase family)
VSLFLAQIASELTPILANGLGADPAKTQIIFHVCNALMLTIRSLQLYDESMWFSRVPQETQPSRIAINGSMLSSPQ